MEDLESFWTFEKSNVDFEVDELKQKLHYTAYQLELARKETSEEIRKSHEHMKQLLQLLETTSKERDEAKAQLKEFQQIMAINKPNYGSTEVGSRYNKSNHTTMTEYGSIEAGSRYNKFNYATTMTQYGSTEVGSRFNKLNNVVNNHTIIPTTGFPESPFSPDSPLLTTNHLPTKTNSSTSSFSLETQTTTTNNNNVNNNNQQSYVSSPVVDSFSSPDSGNIVNFTTPVAQNPATLPTKIDKESLIIANLAKDKPLPTKGNLLKAILEAGPLLSTLMVAGSLPQWRTPPGALTHQIPPVNLKGSVIAGPGLGLSPSPSLSLGAIVTSQNKLNFMNMANFGTSAMYNGHVSNTSSGSIGISPSSMLDFGSGSCFMGGRMMVNSGVSFDCQISKRQRII